MLEERVSDWRRMTLQPHEANFAIVSYSMHKILAYLSHELHRLYADSSLACGHSHYTDEPRAIEKPASRLLLEDH